MKKKLVTKKMLDTYTPDSLKSKIIDSVKELFSLKLSLASGNLKEKHMLRKIRKEIARYKTILNFYRLDAAQSRIVSQESDSTAVPLK